MTTWDPANSFNATLSGGNLVVTFNSNSFSNGTLSSTSKSSGKFVFDIGVVCGNPSDNANGITQGHPPGAFYDSSTSWLFVPQSSYTGCRHNGNMDGFDTTSPVPTSPYTVRVYVDLTALKIYFSVGGVYYFGGDASAGTGGLTLSAGTFYINGYSTAGGDQLTLNTLPTGLPAGWSAWDAPPRIDAKDHATGFSGTTRTLTLTTTQPLDYIIVSAVTNSTGIASVVGSSLGSFTLISSAARGGSSTLQVWAKFALSPLTAETITVTQNTSDFMTCDAWAVADTRQTSLVWSTGSPQKVDNASTSVSITTTEAKSVVFGAHAVNDNGVTPASGYTSIYGSDYALTQYKELSAAGTETISGGSSVLQASIAVAIPIAPIGTIWNASDQRNVTITGGGLFATIAGTNFTYDGVRATTSKSGSGKYVIDMTCSNNHEDFVGFSIGGKSNYYNSGPDQYQLYPYSGGMLFEVPGGSWLFFDNTSLPGGQPSAGTPYKVRFFLDLNNSKFYVQINGTNMGGCDPVAQTGGFTFTPSVGGPLFPFFAGVYGGEAVALNPNPTSLPTGWTAWDGTPSPVTLVDSTIRSSGTGTSVSISSVPIGPAFADRVVVLACGIESSADPVTVTIGGVAADLTFNSAGTFMASAAVPTGTTATVAFTLTTSDVANIHGVWSLSGMSPHPSDKGSVAGASSITLTVPAGGCALIHGVSFGTSTAGSWTNATGDFDHLVSGPARLPGARYVNPGSSTSRTFTYTASAFDDRTGMTFAPSAGGGTDTNITPAKANLVLSSVAPTVAISANRSISPAKGNLALSQTAPTVVTTTLTPVVAPLLMPISRVIARRKPWFMHPAPVDSTATVTPVDTPITPAAAALTLTSTAPDLSFGTVITPPKADLVLSQTAPVVAATANIAITPAKGNLALSQTAPAIATTANVAITVPAGALALSTTAPTANASTTITVPKADLTLSQTAPAVVWTDNHPVSPPAASLTLNETPPSVVIDIRPVSIKGDLTLTTTPPVVAWTDNRNIAPTGAQLALNRTAPSVAATANIAIVPPAGSLTLSQTAPSVSTGANVNISPASVSLALNRTAPTAAVTANVAIIPASVSLSLNATAPTLAQTQHVFVTPPSVTLALSSNAPGVQAGNSYSIVPPKQSLTLASTAPTVAVTANVAVVPLKGSLTLSQTAPAVGTNWNITPAKGNLTLSQTPPVIGGVTQIIPAAAALTLSSTAPLVAVPITITVPKADLVLTGTPPLTGGIITRQPGAGSVTLSSQPPVVVRTANVNVVPPAGALALSPAAPVLTAATIIAPPRGLLTLSQAAPAVSQGIARLPLKGSVTISTTAPTVAVTTHRVITPSTAELSLSSEQVLVTMSQRWLIIPATCTLNLIELPPRITVTRNDLPFTIIKGRYLRSSPQRARMLQSADQRVRDLKYPIRRPRDFARVGFVLEEA